MKKTLLTAAIAVFMTLVSIPEARAQFGIYVGYQAARYTDNGKIDDKPFNGVRLELDYTWMFGKYFGTGIHLTQGTTAPTHFQGKFSPIFRHRSSMSISLSS